MRNSATFNEIYDELTVLLKDDAFRAKDITGLACHFISIIDLGDGEYAYTDDTSDLVITFKTLDYFYCHGEARMYELPYADIVKTLAKEIHDYLHYKGDNKNTHLEFHLRWY